MTLTLWLLMAAALSVTFANGANDNFKGVATLFGSGTTNYRRALLWGSVSTLAGCLAAMALATSLVARFSGQGLLPASVTADPAFLTAVAGGAATTVLLATWTGFPISTTHALMGGLVGAGLLAAPGEFSFAALQSGFVAPLLLSPLLAALVVGLLYAGWRPFRARWRSAAPVTTATDVTSGAHYLSAGAVGFARGVNDAPKLVALLLPAQAALSPNSALLLIAGVMTLGGLLAARRVAETLSHRVTSMTHGEGPLANVTTATLVIGAARFGLPVSTTHVSTGALIGLGAVTAGAHWKKIGQIVLAWVATLPCAALCAAALWWLLRF